MKAPFLTYDVEQLKADVPIDEVIQMYTGERVMRNGSVRCPAPDHPDENPSAKVYQKTNTCHCFSCDSSFDAIDVVRLNENLSFRDACERLINDFGLDRYAYSNQREIDEYYGNPQKQKEFRDEFPLTKTEIDTLGLNDPSRKGIKIDYGKDEFGMDISEDMVKTPSLRELWKTGDEERAMVEDMLIAKCQEQLEEIAECKEFILRGTENYYAPENENIRREAKKIFESCVRIKSKDMSVDLDKMLSEKQSQKLNAYEYFEYGSQPDCVSDFEFLTQRSQKIEGILDKLETHRDEREKYLKKGKTDREI